MTVRTTLRRAGNPVAVVALAIALVGGTGVATAATGGTFILGRSNTAGSRTGLTSTAGTPLSLTAKTGYPPLAVSNDVKVSRLNADELDGLNSTDLQRRITGSCPGGAVAAVGSAGTVTCAALPVKLTASGAADPTGIDTAVGTVAGVSLWVRCTRVDETDGSRVVLQGYFTGSGIANGHAITTLSDGSDTIDPIGATIPVFGTAGALPSFGAPNQQYARQTVVAMVANGGTVTQWTLHLFADGRDLSLTGKPCVVWGVAV